MKKYLLASAILFSFSLPAQAEEAARPPVDPQHQPTQMFNADVYETSNAILFSIPEKKVQYYITKPNNPAYPAVIENQVLGRNQDIRFKANGFAKADNEAAIKWLEEIDQINKDRLAKLKANQ
jgi:hypothetical protein